MAQASLGEDLDLEVSWKDRGWAKSADGSWKDPQGRGPFLLNTETGAMDAQFPLRDARRTSTETALAKKEPRFESAAAMMAETPRFHKEAVSLAMDNATALAEMMRDHMLEGHHFGKVPGAADPSLWEPGASLILNGFRMYTEPIRVDRVEDDDGHLRYLVINGLHPIGHPEIVVATGVGSASTREVKYAYRWGDEKDVPPDVDKVMLKTKTAERGRQQVTLYRIPNQDPGDLDNTLLKMATKRSEVDGVMHLPGCSELFPRSTSKK